MATTHSSPRMPIGGFFEKYTEKEFIKWFKLTNEVNPLLRFFEEKEIPVPTLYLMGEEDHMFLPPVQMLIKRHHYATLKVIENSGHVCNIDQPEHFNAEAIEFIKQTALGQGALVVG
ncbi:MAG: alpha/beta hydrolase, partial [Chlorobiales bacterium]|nr:alpha/beta hydrolase [Chlorobiales bacterium]